MRVPKCICKLLIFIFLFDTFVNFFQFNLPQIGPCVVHIYIMDRIWRLFKNKTKLSIYTVYYNGRHQNRTLFFNNFSCDFERVVLTFFLSSNIYGKLQYVIIIWELFSKVRFLRTYHQSVTNITWIVFIISRKCCANTIVMLVLKINTLLFSKVFHRHNYFHSWFFTIVQISPLDQNKIRHCLAW